VGRSSAVRGRCGGEKLWWWGGRLAWRTSGGMEELRRDGRSSAGRRSGGDTVSVLFFWVEMDIFGGLGSTGSGSMLVISSNDMSKHRERFGRETEAAGSTSPGAFSSLPIRLGGFGKAQRAATPFGSFGRLFSLESRRKPKQTPPYSCLGWLLISLYAQDDLEEVSTWRSWQFGGPRATHE
jgi:hypothetical protein